MTTNERFSSQRVRVNKSTYQRSRDVSEAYSTQGVVSPKGEEAPPDDAFGAEGKAVSEVKRFDDIRVEKGLDNTANVDFEG